MMLRFLALSFSAYLLLFHQPWVLADPLPSPMEVARYWHQATAAVDIFHPQLVASPDEGSLWFTGWRSQEFQARWWPSDSSAAVIVSAVLPSGWGAPDDGLEWISVRPPVWTVQGLPDRDGYCLHDQALALARAAEVVKLLRRRQVPVVLVAEGLGAPAALAVAAAETEHIAGVVLLDPAPYRHLTDAGTGLPGRAGQAVLSLLSRHPSWREALKRSLAYYDLATLAPAVRCPVVAIVSQRPAWWIDEAASQWGWTVLPVAVAQPRLAGLTQRPWFPALWADCLEALKAEA